MPTAHVGSELVAQHFRRRECLPQEHRLIRACASHPLTVGAERHRKHRAGVPGEGIAERLSGVGVPQPHCAVIAGTGQPMPIGAECDSDHHTGVPGEGVIERLSGVGVPQPRRRTISKASALTPSNCQCALDRWRGSDEASSNRATS
jgi:hypothetical protein